jgi:hypothetical protein
MLHHTSKKAKAGWLLLSGAMLGSAMYIVIVGAVILRSSGSVKKALKTT